MKKLNEFLDIFHSIFTPLLFLLKYILLTLIVSHGQTFGPEERNKEKRARRRDDND
jgi:hypothetical protein